MWCFKSDHSGPQLLCTYVQCWSNFFIYTSSFIGIMISWLNLCSAYQPLCVCGRAHLLSALCVQNASDNTAQSRYRLKCFLGWWTIKKPVLVGVDFLHPTFAVLWEVRIHLVLICSSQSIIKRWPGQHCLHFIRCIFAPLFIYSSGQETVVTV